MYIPYSTYEGLVFLCKWRTVSKSYNQNKPLTLLLYFVKTWITIPVKYQVTHLMDVVSIKNLLLFNEKTRTMSHASSWEVITQGINKR